MSLIPWKPNWDMDRWFEDFELPAMKTPRMDIYETENDVVAEVELPGISPENIDIEVTDNALKVEAKVEQKKEEKKKGYYRKEIGTGYYKRVVPLPTEVKGAEAQAEYEGGMLKITMPKVTPGKEETKGTKIKIKEKK